MNSIPQPNISGFIYCEDCNQLESLDSCTSASTGVCNCCSCRSIPTYGYQDWEGRAR